MARKRESNHIGDTGEGGLTSGAPEYGGATTHGSSFGGDGFVPSLLRAVARLARSVEAASYRKLRELDVNAGPLDTGRGRPRRVKEAARGPHPLPS